MTMEIIGPLVLSTIAGLSTMIGTILIFIKIKNINRFLVFCLSFSMGTMIFISLLDLMPNSIFIILENYGLLYGITIIVLTFILGYLTIDKLDKIIKENDQSLYRIGMLGMLSLMIHNFPEGIAVSMSAYSNIKLGFKMCLAIMMHNIPEGIIISIPIYYAKKSRGKALKLTLLSSIAEPIGALLSLLFLKSIITNTLISIILVFVSGLMISLSINDIFKEIKKYNSIQSLILGIISSLILCILII